MNTGHEGSLSTCHANSPADALRRLETMVMMDATGLPLAAVRDQLAAALDLVVQVARRPDGGRAVVAVHEVLEQVLDQPQVPGPRTRPLAGPAGLHALPARAPRSPDAPGPDRSWLRP
jgi:pilus assembly protein CpaF